MCECVCGEVGGPGMNFQLPGSLHPPRCGSILFSANGSVSPYRVFMDRRRREQRLRRGPITRKRTHSPLSDAAMIRPVDYRSDIFHLKCGCYRCCLSVR